MSKTVGIDLGTTNSVAAAVMEGGRGADASYASARSDDGSVVD